MKTSILLPVGGLLLLLGNSVNGQNSAYHNTSDTSVTTHQQGMAHATVITASATENDTYHWRTPSTPAAVIHTGGFNAPEFQSRGQMRATGVSGYTTSLGLRGGYTSGITLKHFVKSNAALEFVLGTRWEGFSFSMLYEWHSPNAFGASQLTWVYGLGARVGNYRGSRFFSSGRGNCNNPNDKNCSDYWGDRSLTAIGLVGIGGLEFKFDEIPVTLSLDLMPVLYLNYWGGTFIDASVSARYILK